MTVKDLQTALKGYDEELEMVITMDNGTEYIVYSVSGHGLVLGLNEAHCSVYAKTDEWILTR